MIKLLNCIFSSSKIEREDSFCTALTRFSSIYALIVRLLLNAIVKVFCLKSYGQGHVTAFKRKNHAKAE